MSNEFNPTKILRIGQKSSPQISSYQKPKPRPDLVSIILQKDPQEFKSEVEKHREYQEYLKQKRIAKEKTRQEILKEEKRKNFHRTEIRRFLEEFFEHTENTNEIVTSKAVSSAFFVKFYQKLTMAVYQYNPAKYLSFVIHYAGFEYLLKIDYVFENGNIQYSFSI